MSIDCNWKIVERGVKQTKKHSKTLNVVLSITENILFYLEPN